MSATRLEILRTMVEQKPEDAFGRYGLAMEYVRTGDLEAAVAEFEALLAHNPGYAAGYFHGGQTLEKLGRADEARALYRQGIAQTRDEHARGEMQAALDSLGAG